MQKLLVCLFIVLLPQNALLSQTDASKDIDSLKQLNFKELYQNAFKRKDIPKEKLYAKIYLQKAKDLDSVSEMARGYLWVSTFFENDYKKRIVHLDSGIAVVKNTEHVLQTGSLYLTKGLIIQEEGDYNKALEYYIEGLENSKETNVSFYTSIFRHKIAHLKRKLGKYNEAKIIYKKCLTYEKTQIGKEVNDSLRYLNILSDLIFTYRLNKEIDSSNYFFNKGKEMSLNTDIEGVYVIHKGIFRYYDKDYDNAIKHINEGLMKFRESEFILTYGYHNLIDGYLFLGKSHNALNQKEIANSYFRKIDSVVQLSSDLISESRPAYVEIIKYYKSISDSDNQLHYINKLLDNDSVFNYRYRYTGDKLNKEFDTPILISQKENIIQKLKNKNNQSYYVIFIAIIITVSVTVFLIISYKKNKRYEKRFNELMLTPKKEIISNEFDQNNISTAIPESIDISEDVVEGLIKKLEDFEKNNGFLEINITSSILAKKMDTNSKYLTKVIKFYRNKSFSPYINDLRIDYIIDQLKIDKKIQKYTIKALATEAGFNSAQVFSRYFHKRTGINPSYFIKQIQS